MNGEEFERVFEEWLGAWNSQDLDAVIALFAEDAVFESWNGMRVEGREGIGKAWRAWFDGDPFEFSVEELFFDEVSQRAAFAWVYEGPGTGGAREPGRETRRGVDLIRFEDGKIVRKTTYSKTTIEIDGRRRVLGI